MTYEWGQSTVVRTTMMKQLFESYGGDNETKNDIADNDNDDNKTENDDEEIACEGMGLGQDSWPELQLSSRRRAAKDEEHQLCQR